MTDIEEIRSIHDAVALCRRGPCAVLYGASWCQSSLRLRDALARHPGLPLVWADVDACPEMAAQDAVQGIPTLVLRQDGAPVARRIGMQDAEEIVNWLADHGIVESRPGRRGLIERVCAATLVGLVGAGAARRI